MSQLCLPVLQTLKPSTQEMNETAFKSLLNLMLLGWKLYQATFALEHLQLETARSSNSAHFLKGLSPIHVAHKLFSRFHLF